MECINSSTCVKCSDNYVLYEGKCYTKRCDDKTYNNNIVCGNGCDYFISNKPNCNHSSVEFCKIIDSNNKFIECDDGMKVNQDENCSDNQLEGCKTYEGDHCSQTQDGYVITRNGIEPCPNKLCRYDIKSDGIEEYKCNDQYLIINTDTGNHQCVSTNENCVGNHRSETKVCKSCSEGYHLENGKCVIDTDQTCSNKTSNECYQCSSEYIKINNKCRTKDGSCSVVNRNTTRCLQCTLGFKMNSLTEECESKWILFIFNQK